MMLNRRLVARALNGDVRGRSVSAPGPGHSRTDRSLSILLDPAAPDGFVVHSFAGDDPLACRDYVRAATGLGRYESLRRQPAPKPVRTVAPDDSGHHISGIAAHQREQRQHAVARQLWSGRRFAVGTIVERYLRRRGYHGAIQPTLGFLPPIGKYPPAMIAAFGFAQEPEPGRLAIDDETVTSVHITALLPDGSDRVRTPSAKRIVGRPLSRPIVLAPANDLLALAVTEGIEDALALSQALGIGGWAAGSAPMLPAWRGTSPTTSNASRLRRIPTVAGGSRSSWRNCSVAAASRHSSVRRHEQARCCRHLATPRAGRPAERI